VAAALRAVLRRSPFSTRPAFTHLPFHPPHSVSQLRCSGCLPERKLLAWRADADRRPIGGAARGPARVPALRSEAGRAHYASRVPAPPRARPVYRPPIRPSRPAARQSHRALRYLGIGKWCVEDPLRAQLYSLCDAARSSGIRNAHNFARCSIDDPPGSRPSSTNTVYRNAQHEKFLSGRDEIRLPMAQAECQAVA
jgi:hypothetical protein